MNTADIVLVLIIVMLLFFAVRRIIHTRKSGGCSCGCGCGSDICRSCGSNSSAADGRSQP